jgi:hypothetical protein
VRNPVKHLIVDEEEPSPFKDRSEDQIRDLDLRFAAGAEECRRRSSGFIREPAERNAESVVIALRNANSPLVSYLKP